MTAIKSRMMKWQEMWRACGRSEMRKDLMCKPEGNERTAWKPSVINKRMILILVLKKNEAMFRVGFIRLRIRTNGELLKLRVKVQ
jgi:hypothetical protein